MFRLASLTKAGSARRGRLIFSCLLIITPTLSLVLRTRLTSVSGAQGECRVECAANVPATSAAGAQVQFNATASLMACASSPGYEWDFGDGTPSLTQQNVLHRYTAPGVYTWKMTASASTGGTTIETIAGSYGENALAPQAPFTTPVALARDPQGRGLYIADDAVAGSLLRFINTGTASAGIGGKVISAGRVRVLFGGEGRAVYQNIWDVAPSEVAMLVRGVAASPGGEVVYLADDANARVWAYNVSSATVAVMGRALRAGNLGVLAAIPTGGLSGLAVHPFTGEVYLASAAGNENRVVKILPGGNIMNIAGNGATSEPTDAFPTIDLPATAIPLLQARSLAFDSAGNLFIADSGHGRIIKIEANGHASLVTQFPVTPSSNPFPAGLAFLNSNLYVALGNAQTIVQIAASGSRTIIAGLENTACDTSLTAACGDGGPVAAATFRLQSGASTPPTVGLEADANGLYVLDQGDLSRGRVRYLNLFGANTPRVILAGVTIGRGRIETIAGSGLRAPYDGGAALGGVFNYPVGAALDGNNNLFVSDTLAARLRFINRGSNDVTLFPGTPAQQIVEPGAIVTINKNVGPLATDGVPANQAGFETPQGLTITNQGLFVADSRGGQSVNLRRTGLIRFINTSSASVTFFPNSTAPITVVPGNIATIVGGGTNFSDIGNGGFARRAKLLGPSDVAVNQNTGDLFIADTGNRAVRRVAGDTGNITSLNLPSADYTGLALDQAGRLYVVNSEAGQVLRELSAGSGQFTALNTTKLNGPRDVAVDGAGTAYVTVAGDARIAKISPAGAVEILAGGSSSGFSGDGGAAANAKLDLAPDAINVSTLGPAVYVAQTVNVAVGTSGEVVFTDTRNGRIRRVGAGSAGCFKTGTITIAGDNPVPSINKLTPDYVAVGGREYTLTINGAGFVTNSGVRVGGVDRAANYISSTVLTVTIAAADLTRLGPLTVSVFNPAPGGGLSAPATITVSQPNPTPLISNLTPSMAAPGAGFTLTVQGSRFAAKATVQWNGSPRPTTFVSEEVLRAEITANDLLTLGEILVSVNNPEPGGGPSNKFVFRVTATNLAPEAARLAPFAALVGGSGFTLQVNGADFSAASKIRWNGEDRPTTFVDTETLLAQITAADIARVGAASVTVFTPAPGGGVTQALAFAVGRPATATPAASYSGNTLALESIGALFGTGLSAATTLGASTPLPTLLGATEISIRDVSGRESAAPLFFVSPAQVNFYVPTEVATGQATLIVRSGGEVAAVATVQIAPVVPTLFSADATGQGIVAGLLLRVGANGAQRYEPLARYDEQAQRYAFVPIEQQPGEQLFLIVYGSGIRNRSTLAGVKARYAALDAPVTYAGAVAGLVGLDQVNIGPLPCCAPSGLPLSLTLTVDGRTSNVVTLMFK